MGQRRRIVTAGQIVTVLLALASPASAQVDPCPKPVNQPPPASAALLRCVQAVFHPDGAQSLDNDTLTYYLRDIEGSDSTRDRWVRYDESAILTAFDRLWKTQFFDDLWVEVIDEPYDNGIPAKHVVFHMEERPRLKTFEYTGSKVVAVSKIGEVLNARGIVRFGGGFLPDAFILIRQIRGVIKELLRRRAIRTQPSRSRRR